MKIIVKIPIVADDVSFLGHSEVVGRVVESVAAKVVVPSFNCNVNSNVTNRDYQNGNTKAEYDIRKGCFGE